MATCSSCQKLEGRILDLKEELFLLKQDLIKKGNLINQLEKSSSTTLSMTPLSFKVLDDTCQTHYCKRHLLDGIDGYASYISTYVIPSRVRLHKRSTKEVFYFIREGERVELHISAFVRMILKSTEDKTERLYQEVKNTVTGGISKSNNVADMVKLVAQRHYNMALIRGQKDELIDKVSQILLRAL